MANGTATSIEVTGMSEGFIEGWWGEEVIEGGTITMTVNNDGTVVIPRQYVYTTLWDGDPYDYEIAGAGTWDNCGASPTMLIIYDVYYEGDEAGLAETYSAYLNEIPYLTADITLSTKKSEKIFNKVSLKPAPRK